MPWEKRPQPWTDVVIRGLKKPTGVHCRTCTCERCETTRKQTTRLCKVKCRDCGCLLRMTRTWIERVGLPTCGCGGRMGAEIPPILAIPPGQTVRETWRQRLSRAAKRVHSGAEQ